MADKPVFHDPSGRRRRRFSVGVIAFVAMLLTAVAVFALSILAVPPNAPLPFDVERPPLHGSEDTLAHRTRQRIRHFVRTTFRTTRPGPGQRPLAVAFYQPWDDSSRASLARHVEDIDWLVPDWMSVTGADHHITVWPDTSGRLVLSHAAHRPRVLPLIQNVIEGEWDVRNTALLFHDPRARKTLLDRLEAFLADNHADGICFDFEQLPASAQPDYRQFLREAKARFAPHHWLVTLAVPVDDDGWDLPAYAAIADRLFIMAYDEHYGTGQAGPIASEAWFTRVVAEALKDVPPEKAIIAIASYGYDWAAGEETEAVSVEDGWLRAHESSVFPRYDPISGNVSVRYTEGDKPHEVWFQDAVGAYNQMRVVRRAGLNHFALWRMGTEDQSLWSVFGRGHRDGGTAQALADIPAGTDADIEGAGEILKVASVPIPGMRRIEIDASGRIIAAPLTRIPLPYAVQRAGYRPKLVALTFDDGPDPHWTPRVLDVLKRYQVPATFFIIGENALTERGLLKRLVAEGHEVGNHTYTHPNLALLSKGETNLELNATQRLFQAFTGRSLRLFRAPYFGDAEPTTTDELDPVWEAQQRGYLSVGLHVDPGDWKRPGTQAIVDGTIEGVLASTEDRSGNVVLLHDSGGDRSQTVEALPQIIEQLRAKGYRFVGVSELIGLPRAAVMPHISKSDRLAAEADLALFTLLGWITIGLKWLFFIAISVGILRAMTLSALALWQSRKELRTVFPPIDPERLVSVLIPAFNEARVIARSVARVLDSRDVRIEVIVIDDGSKDGTSDVVTRAFGDNPRVQLLTLENGGKARALNRGLALAQGEIVVALDADTQFEPTTIARLARWFADPAIGAVAGNAKVGNRVNLVTAWQALEYITAQNLERRALASLDAMTVVPGAVGAWRVETLRQVGGYPADTLAEDQDLTIAVQRRGWTVHYDQYAVAWTEAPESFAALAKQRFRWAYGTLQCLTKHRKVITRGRPRGLARIGLPQAILFQIMFAAISPVIDLALVISIVATGISVHQHGWAQTSGDIQTMAIYWAIFSLIDLLSGVVAFALERRERWRLLWLLVPQRIGYRQVMYYVVIKALTQAARGSLIGWGKLERSGRVGTA